MFIFLFSLLSYFLYISLKIRKSIYMLQQNFYNEGNRYYSWIIKNSKSIFINEVLTFVVPVILYFYFPNNIFITFVFVFNFFMFYNESSRKRAEQIKLPFKVTSRVKRLIFTCLLIFGILITMFTVNYKAKYLLLYYVILEVIAYLSDFFVLLVNFINKPVEKMVYIYYYRKAVKKLKSMSSLIKVGITGSYGKTSSKNILNEMLNVKYNSFATKKSFNTPYGLMISINNHLDKFDNVFIAEMGAFKVHDIKQLCDLVKPKYGILTKIGVAHLETFKTEENIAKTKFELIESLPSDGVAILNRDDEKQVNYPLKNKVKIIWIGFDNNADVIASNVKQSNTGMKFDVTFKDINETYSFETPLLGKFNIYNILAGIALSRELGIEIDKLQKVVSKLRPTEHRLELKKYNDKITFIDDAFNSNPDGAKMALEVLDLMPGKKVIVTPGMIDLGEKEYELNKNFGKQISEVVDAVVLVGEKQTKPILDGLKEANFDSKNIYVLNDVKEAFPLVTSLYNKETFVLLENDLPDIFNEK